MTKYIKVNESRILVFKITKDSLQEEIHTSAIKASEEVVGSLRTM